MTTKAPHVERVGVCKEKLAEEPSAGDNHAWEGKELCDAEEPPKGKSSLSEVEENHGNIVMAPGVAREEPTPSGRVCADALQRRLIDYQTFPRGTHPAVTWSLLRDGNGQGYPGTQPKGGRTDTLPKGSLRVGQNLWSSA